uniref:Uncharacterized protein n=2 Tax=Brassica oleracea TaxID=3712 RepID=A0A0D3DLX1_BRAOL|nr:unnamed protein product [Brassica oleracea]
MLDMKHELASHKIKAMWSDLGRFFLKLPVSLSPLFISQTLEKPDLAPAAWA